MNNDSDIKHMFKIEFELEIKDLLKIILNFSFSILVNILNEYYFDNKSVDDNSDD